jgi:hypothetical protein
MSKSLEKMAQSHYPSQHISCIHGCGERFPEFGPTRKVNLWESDDHTYRHNYELEGVILWQS